MKWITGVRSLVSLEVRTFGVDFLASGKLALVDAATFGHSTPRRCRSQTQSCQRSDGCGGRVPAGLTAEFRGSRVRCSRSGGSGGNSGVDRQGFAIAGCVPAGRRRRRRRRCRRQRRRWLECRDHRGADGFGAGRRSEKLTSWRLVVMVIESDSSSMRMMRPTTGVMMATARTAATRTTRTTVVRMDP